MFYDTLHGEYVSKTELKKEFDFLVLINEVDTTSFILYLSDCIKSGTLQVVKNCTII